MAINVLMPQMGESIFEATLTKWHKKVGDKIQREEVLFEISTDKVDQEVFAQSSGVLTQVLFPEGSTVQVNAIMAVIDEAGSATASGPAAAAAPAPAAPAAAAAAPVASVHQADASRVVATPVARKMAAEANLDLSKLSPGSGEHGKVMKADVQSALSGSTVVPASVVAQVAQVIAQPQPVKSATAPQLASLGGSASGIIEGVRSERVAMTPARRKVAEHMVMSKHTSPHVTSVIEVDCQKIVDLRSKFKDKFEAQYGFKLTFMPFFMTAAIEALKAVPVANASVDGDSIIYYKDINLGVAVAQPWGGLVVPVIKNAQERNFVGLARALNDVADRARTKKLTLDDLKGGTFSVSNFGGFGTIIGQPIINQPQVGIFGLGAMEKRPVVINDAIAIRTMCYAVFSFDHRVMDGADSGKFLSTVKQIIENWSTPVL